MIPEATMPGLSSEMLPMSVFSDTMGFEMPMYLKIMRMRS